MPLVGDIGKARRVLQWAPQVDLRTLMHEMVEHDLALLRQQTATDDGASNDRTKRIDRCRICGSTDLVCVLDLGEQALTGVFPRSRDQEVTVGPLRLVKCDAQTRAAACCSSSTPTTSRRCTATTTAIAPA